MKKFLFGMLVLLAAVILLKNIQVPAPFFSPEGFNVAADLRADEQPAVFSDSPRVVTSVPVSGVTARVVIQEAPELSQDLFDAPDGPNDPSPIGFGSNSPPPLRYQKSEKPATAEQQLAQLRKEYSRIATDKAGIMTLEELEVEVARAKTELAELKATRELESAVAKLNGLIKDFPETPAAKKAKELLKQQETAEKSGPVDAQKPSLLDKLPTY